MEITQLQIDEARDVIASLEKKIESIILEYSKNKEFDRKFIKDWVENDCSPNREPGSLEKIFTEYRINSSRMLTGNKVIDKKGSLNRAYRTLRITYGV